MALLHLQSRKCAGRGCQLTGKDVKLFRFPRNSVSRYKQWATVTNNPELDINKMTHAYLCARHFERNQFRDAECTALITRAVPSIVVSSQPCLPSIQPTEVLPEESTSSHVLDHTYVLRGDSSFQSNCNTKPKCATQLNFSTESRTVKNNNNTSETIDDSPLISAEDYIDASLSGISCSGNKRKFSVLKEINCTRYKKLTPRKKVLISIIHNRERALTSLRRKYKKTKTTIEELSQMNSNPVRSVEHLSKYMSLSSAQLLASQFRCATKKPNGRRWTLNDKLLALSMYKRSPKCYTLLQTIFALPSPRILIKLLNQVPLQPGICKPVFEALTKYVANMDKADRCCMLMFDEMCIRENVQYDRSSDSIVGFEDLGDGGRTDKVANHVLVFMVKGLRRKWKQPVAFYFTRGGMRSDIMQGILHDVLHACEVAGLLIFATVCDMGANNVKTLKLFGVSVTQPYFVYNSREIACIFDVPHLLKCLRNMLLRHNVCVKLNIGEQTVSGLATWQHIRDAYQKDKLQPLYNHLHKLTKDHLDPVGYLSMRVSIAAQVLSHTVAATISGLVANGVLQPEALGTAHFVGFANKLFDSLNGRTAQPSGAAGLKCQLRVEREALHMNFWETAVHEVDSWNFERKLSLQNATAGKNFKSKFFRPPCQDGWLITIKAIQHLWSMLKENGFSSLQLRSVNQDEIEHLFGSVRQNCGSNNNPTLKQFIAALKTCVVNRLALNDLKRSNCEEESNPVDILINLHNFLQTDLHDANTTSNESHPEVGCVSKVSDKFTVCKEFDLYSDSFSVSYVSGFIANKILARSTCDRCRTTLTTLTPDEFVHSGITFKEYNEGKCGLTYPSDKLTCAVGEIATCVENALPEIAHLDCIQAKLIATIMNEVDFVWLQEGCQDHVSGVSKQIIEAVCKISIPWWCKRKNREISDFGRKKSLQRKVKILKHK